MRRLAMLSVLALALGMAPGHAIHFYRGTGGGCSPASGAKGAAVPAAATVTMLHNSYHDGATNLPVTRIRAGQSVKWTWNSAHCHSVTGNGFDSGFHYPSAEPNSPRVLPGFFDYPIPESTATLSFTRTFPVAGTFQYACVHHAAIGMAGVVIVE